MAPTQPGAENRPDSRLAQPNSIRVLMWVAAILVVGGWGWRVGGMLYQGYHKSSKVLDNRERVAELAAEKEDLIAEVAHADTDEGRVEQVKTLFGAGPPDDVLLNVHVKSGGTAKPPVVGLHERTDAYITAATDRCLKCVRRIRDVWKYWATRPPMPPLANNESSDAK